MSNGTIMKLFLTMGISVLLPWVTASHGSVYRKYRTDIRYLKNRYRYRRRYLDYRKIPNTDN